MATKDKGAPKGQAPTQARQPEMFRVTTTRGWIDNVEVRRTVGPGPAFTAMTQGQVATGSEPHCAVTNLMAGGGLGVVEILAPGAPSRDEIAAAGVRAGAQAALRLVEKIASRPLDDETKEQALARAIVDLKGITVGSTTGIESDPQVVRVEHQPGYEIRYYADPAWGSDLIPSAYTASGEYIGSPEDARYIVEVKGIAPEVIEPGQKKACCIGFCEREQKWYGWSHRSMQGFGVGDECTSSTDFDGQLPKGFKATTLDDAKRMAVAFAEAIS